MNNKLSICNLTEIWIFTFVREIPKQAISLQVGRHKLGDFFTTTSLSEVG